VAARKHSRRPKPQIGLHTDRPLSPLFGVRYPLMVAAIAAPLFAIYFYPYSQNSAMAAGIQSYLSAYARMAGAVLAVFDPQVGGRGEIIAGPSFSMRIVKTCDAMDVNILLVAALAGFPMPLLRRVLVIVASVGSLILINVVRLCLLYWLGVRAPTWFNSTHEILAPLFMVICALAIFLIATRRTSSGSSAGPVRVISES
jgi:exosortase/archaeosortase family protein